MSNIYDIADAFLRKDSLDARKIQYLCYYFKGWSLAKFNADYLEQYNFFVTEFGPMNEHLLDKFPDVEDDVRYIPDKGDLNITMMERQLVESVWRTYGDWSTEELMIQSKMEPPYLLARVGNMYEDEEIDENIRVEHMNIYFKGLVNNEYHTVEDYYPPYEEEIINIGRVRRKKV